MEHRRKGYTSQILSKICSDLIAENKTPCLFYDNPKAGSIYHRLGFESIDSWMMIENKNKVRWGGFKIEEGNSYVHLFVFTCTVLICRKYKSKY